MPSLAGTLLEDIFCNRQRRVRKAPRKWRVRTFGAGAPRAHGAVPRLCAPYKFTEIFGEFIKSSSVARLSTQLVKTPANLQVRP